MGRQLARGGARAGARRRTVNALSAAWLLLALVGVAWTGVRGADVLTTTAPRAARSKVAADATLGRLPSGEQGVVDADGFLVPVRPYKQIAGVSTLVDSVLLALVEPERIRALTDYGFKHSQAPWLYGDRFLTSSLEQMELLMEQKVDLLVLNKLGAQQNLSRIRESGIQVLNLGEMRGLSTLLPNIAALSAVLGVPERGQALADTLVRRLHQVAADIPQEKRKRALYVSAYANQLFGGALDTSYHDVLTAAGLNDVTEGKYRGHVQYDPEQVLELDPELIVSNLKTRKALCLLAGLERLRACQNGGAGIVGLTADLMGDPGPRMLDAAEALRSAVYGPPP